MWPESEYWGIHSLVHSLKNRWFLPISSLIRLFAKNPLSCNINANQAKRNFPVQSEECSQCLPGARLFLRALSPASFLVVAPACFAVSEEVPSLLGRTPLEQSSLSWPSGDADIIYNGNCCKSFGLLQFLEKIAPRL